MTFKRFSVALAVFAAVAVAVPSFAGAVKAPTYYRYGKCTTKILCTISLYTNSNNTQIVTLQFGLKCKNEGETINAYNSAAIKINSKHKFSATMPATSYNTGDAQSTAGTLTVSGKVSKQNKVTGKYSVDKVASGCEGAKSGNFTLKYKGKQTGG